MFLARFGADWRVFIGEWFGGGLVAARISRGPGHREDSWWATDGGWWNARLGGWTNREAGRGEGGDALKRSFAKRDSALGQWC